jgi:hypothetical protein
MEKEPFIDGFNKYLVTSKRNHPPYIDLELSEKLYDEYQYYFESKADFVPVKCGRAYISTSGAENFLIKNLRNYVYLNSILVKVTTNDKSVFSIQGLVEVCDQDFILKNDEDRKKVALKQCKITSETIIKGDIHHKDVLNKKVEFFNPVSYFSLDIPNNNNQVGTFLHEKLFFKHSDIVEISQTHGILLHPLLEAKYRALAEMTNNKKSIEKIHKNTKKNINDFIEQLEIRLKREVLQHLERLENRLALSEIDSPPVKESYTHSSELLKIMDNVIWTFWERHDENNPPKNAIIEKYMLENWPNKLQEAGKNELNAVGRYIRTIIRPEKYRKNN